MRQPCQGEPLRLDEVGEHIAGPYARKLVRVPDEEQVCAGGEGLHQLVGEQHIEHAHLIHHHQVCLKWAVRPATRLPTGA